MKSAWHFFLYSHLYIGICAVALLGYFDLFSTGLVPVYYYLFLFTGTLSLYNAHRYISRRYFIVLQENERYEDIAGYSNWYKYSTPLALGLCLYAFLQFDIVGKMCVVLPFILGALYVLPILPGGKRLRDINYLKLFLIGLCWMLMCCTIPLYLYSDIDQISLISASAEALFFILALTIPFDLRDRSIERLVETKTLLSRLGVRMAYVISISYLIFAYVCHLLGPGGGKSGLELMVESLLILLAYLLTFFAIRKGFKFSGKHYHSAVLDGMMIVLFLSAFVAKALLEYL